MLDGSFELSPNAFVRAGGGLRTMEMPIADIARRTVRFERALCTWLPREQAHEEPINLATVVLVEDGLLERGEMAEAEATDPVRLIRGRLTALGGTHRQIHDAVMAWLIER